MAFQRQMILLDDYELSEHADDSITALLDWSQQYGTSPPVLVNGSRLVRVLNGRILDMTDHGLRDLLSQAVEFGVTNAQGQVRPKYPPLDVVKVLRERDASRFGLREIRAVVTVPTFDESGTLIHTPGIHPSGVWYEPEIENVENWIVEADDVDDVLWAKDILLNDLLGGFDFRDEASRANALALTLLPFVKEMLKDSPTPLHAVIAPQPGSGKTTLVKACLAPGLGDLDVSTEPRDEEELRKKITGVLRNGQRSVVFDNLNQELASSTLAAALTSTKWSDRILGESNNAVFENKLIWAATGNNIGTSSELRDRVCPIWLDPRDGTPARQRSESSFKHPSIIAWALENRAQLAGACITIVLHWLRGHAMMRPDGSFDRGVRRDGQQTMGSFNTWAKTMSAILEEIDVRGFLENRDQLDAVDIDESETETFFDYLLEWSGGNEFSVKQLRPACQFGGELHEHVPGNVGMLRGSSSDGILLGKWLGARQNSVHGGIRLRGRKGARNAWIWRLERLSG